MGSACHLLCILHGCPAVQHHINHVSVGQGIPTCIDAVQAILYLLDLFLVFRDLATTNLWLLQHALPKYSIALCIGIGTSTGSHLYSKLYLYHIKFRGHMPPDPVLVNPILVNPIFKSCQLWDPSNQVRVPCPFNLPYRLLQMDGYELEMNLAFFLFETL